MPCYRIQWSGPTSTNPGFDADVLRCVSSAAYRSSGNTLNGGPWLDCPQLGWNAGSAAVSKGRVTAISSECVDCNRNTPAGFVEPGAGVSPDQRFDCINGNCLPSVTYNTPGFYANQSACQSGCAKNSNCNGECVSAADMARLNQVVAQVRGKYCS